MAKSCAEDAFEYQGVKMDGFGIVTDDSFPGHDNYQNGIIPKGSDTTIYWTNWDHAQLGSGYFTDQATVDLCTHDGVLNSNELGEALQTAPSNYGTNGGDYQHKPNCTAYDVDWERLDDVKNENPDLYGKLTNPDGATPDNDGIKCAYGRAEANTQYGNGGGNQYKIDKDTFNQARDAGIFRENPDKSFSIEKGNLSRQDIPNDKDYTDKLAGEKGAVIANENAKQTPSAEQINSYQAVEDSRKPFIAQPDQAYHYNASLEKKQSSDVNAASQTDQSQHTAPNQSSRQEPRESAGMSVTAPDSVQSTSGGGRQGSSDGMSTKAADLGQSGAQRQDSSGGMSTTAAGKDGSPSPSSSGQSQRSGQSM